MRSKLNIAALGAACLLIAACGKPQVTAPPAGDPIAKALAEGAALVDVRTPEEFADGHFPGAVNIPSGDVGDLSVFPQDGPVVLYCRSGRRASGVLEKLQASGRADVYNLGGLDDGEPYGLRPAE